MGPGVEGFGSDFRFDQRCTVALAEGAWHRSAARASFYSRHRPLGEVGVARGVHRSARSQVGRGRSAGAGDGAMGPTRNTLPGPGGWVSVRTLWKETL